MATSGFLIKGFSNRKPLEGLLRVTGAKNAVLKAQAASVLFKDKILLRNVPFIKDVGKMNELLEDLGVVVEQKGKRSFSFNAPKVLKTDLNSSAAKLFRSSVVLSGPILAREGKVRFPHPGGCVIGQRPIDVFLDAFQKMGAELKIQGPFYELKAKKLKGTEIFFKAQSVTATETVMMTAVLVNGITVLHNCACEPEIACLAKFLNSAGANIIGAGTHTIIVRGGNVLMSGVFNTPPDRIEAGTFAVIAALCGKNLKIANCDPSQMGAVLRALSEVGASVEKGKNCLLIKGPRALRPTDVKTNAYPGFSTDLQAPFSVVLTQAKGRSLLFETIFEGRLNYLSDLKRMGANIVACDPHRAIITGPTRLTGRETKSPDLRAGLAFLIAGMVADGDSLVNNAYNIDRGYEKIEERLNAVGANIKRIINNE